MKKAFGSLGRQSHRGNGPRRWGKREQGQRDGGAVELEIREVGSEEQIQTR